MGLPVTGQQNWGIPLDNYITNVVLAAAQQAQSSINSHTTGTDPHGDRAYAQGLVSPITSGVNGPSGFVKLQSNGLIPSSLLPVGSIKTTFWDVKRDFGATGNGGTDDHTAIQNALNAANSAGGGEVWVPSGTYASGKMLVVYSNTWLHLSPGATIKRIIPSGGSAPSIMLCNAPLTNTTGAGQYNILISGGQWDATGGATSGGPGPVTSACVPITLIGGFFSAIEQTDFTNVAGSPFIELCGMDGTVVRDVMMAGTQLGSAGNVPAIRLSSVTSGYAPAGMMSGAYNNAECQNILIEGCTVTTTEYGQYPSVSRLVGTDTYGGYQHQTVSVTNCGVVDNSLLSYPMVDQTNIIYPKVYGNQFQVGIPGFSSNQLASTINGGSWAIVQTSFWADGQTDFEFFALWGSVDCPAYAGGPQYMLYLDSTLVTYYYNGPVGSYPNAGAPLMGGGVIWHVTQPGIDRPSAGWHGLTLNIKPWTGNTSYVLGPVRIYARPVPLMG